MSQDHLVLLLTIAFFVATAAWVPLLDAVARRCQSSDTWSPRPESDMQRRRATMYKIAVLLTVGAAAFTSFVG